ncbi:MAG: hypothetical protein RRC34_11990 [Lentisphaeria bacterium]|nr:hypothetical protein [Lentisphaeria bacterium]
MTKRRNLCCLTGLIILCCADFTRQAFAAGDDTVPELTPEGKKLQARYEEMLTTLKSEIVAAVPTIDTGKKTAFLSARDRLAGLESPAEGSAAATMTTYNELKQQAEADVLAAARDIIADMDGFLGSDKLDGRLTRIAILSHATPRGLAEFAQQGDAEKALVEKLLSDEPLMKRMLLAGGANGGEWGEAMQTYTAILAASERARETDGVFQRLALGTALQQPWLKGKEKGGVYGAVYADNSAPDGQVARYLHYETAFLNGELDPAFKDMNAWEYRFVTSDPYTNDELAWTREMMRTYRPDHITNPDYKWRYVGIVKTDVPYCSPDWRPDEGTSKVQQIVAGGGKCGPRAFYGRTAARAFGIPARRSTQTGHAAMNHWTPDGWVVCFGAWWAHNWCGPWGGLDFLLESQAREFPDEFWKVLRAQWVGDALGEEDVSIRYYGKGGGLWNALGFYKKMAVVADAEASALQEELAALSEEEAKVRLGETDEAPSDMEENPMIDIPEKDRTIVTDSNGVITIPVAACVKPADNTGRIIFMKNLKDETQAHYARLGKRPELLKYEIDAPKAGTYTLTARVATVAREQTSLIRLNRRTLIDLNLPFSLGMWQETAPVNIDLKEGRNTLMFTCKAPNRGVSIKAFKLTPIQ